MLKKVAILLVLCSVLGGCLAFQEGPPDPQTGIPEPSPVEVGMQEMKEQYEESPFKDLGPYGSIAAILIALGFGTKECLAAYRKRKAAQKANESE